MNEERTKPARRGFAAMSLKQRKEIAALGGLKTHRKHGRKHMSKIGKAGRRKRDQNERKLAKAA